ncbi:hypothetical protein TNCV_226711 [Trichonephila clavipes]|nr:hypothetical protein TNCV_226711 [Trichonephila clavipes]
MESHQSPFRGLLATDLVMLNHGKSAEDGTWTTVNTVTSNKSNDQLRKINSNLSSMTFKRNLTPAERFLKSQFTTGGRRGLGRFTINNVSGLDNRGHWSTAAHGSYELSPRHFQVFLKSGCHRSLDPLPIARVARGGASSEFSLLSQCADDF